MQICIANGVHKEQRISRDGRATDNFSSESFSLLSSAYVCGNSILLNETLWLIVNSKNVAELWLFNKSFVWCRTHLHHNYCNFLNYLCFYGISLSIIIIIIQIIIIKLIIIILLIIKIMKCM